MRGRVRVPRVVAYLILLSLSIIVPGTPTPGRAGAAARDARLMTSPAMCPWINSTHQPGTDLNASYWAVFLRADPGVSWTIHGTYPAARYASLQVYTAQGVLLAGRADVAFPPDSGAVNPFVAGTRRGVGTYTLHLRLAARPARPAWATLYAPSPPGATLVLTYRVYLPDRGALVAPPLVRAQAQAQDQQGGQPVACPLAAAIPPLPALPAGAFQARAGSGFTRQGTATQGGFLNADAAYLDAALPPAWGLYVVRLRAPTTPRTLAGGPIRAGDQVRYWSVCVYDWTGYARNCVVDEQVPLAAHRVATIVLGRTWARPANALAGNGVLWIPLGWDVGRHGVVFRELLPAAAFRQTAFAVPAGADPATTMGPYAPVLRPCSTARFERDQCTP